MLHVAKETYQGNRSSSKSNIEAGADPGKSQRCDIADVTVTKNKLSLSHPLL